MKATKLTLIALVLVFAFTLTASAEDKPTTLKGNLVCGKCTLGKTSSCSNVLVVEKDGKKVNYFLDDKAKGEKYHKGICPPNSKAAATVTGIVYKKGNEMRIKNAKVKLAKK